MEECGLPLDLESYDPARALKAITKSIEDGSTIHFMIHHRLNPYRKSSIVLQWFKTVATLEAGHSFGELALLKERMSEQGRAATIICKTDCSFATLSRKDYIWIIG